VREAVGVGGAVVVFIRSVRWRGAAGGMNALRSREEAVTVGEAEGPGTNGFRLLGGWHVDPSCQMARACKMNANGRFRLSLVMHSCCYRDDWRIFPPFYL
jgi:hypothetical protein